MGYFWRKVETIETYWSRQRFYWNSSSKRTLFSVDQMKHCCREIILKHNEASLFVLLILSIGNYSKDQIIYYEWRDRLGEYIKTTISPSHWSLLVEDSMLCLELKKNSIVWSVRKPLHGALCLRINLVLNRSFTCHFVITVSPATYTCSSNFPFLIFRPINLGRTARFEQTK